MVAGYGQLSREAFEVPLVTDRLYRYRGGILAPTEGGERLPGGAFRGLPRVTILGLPEHPERTFLLDGDRVCPTSAGELVVTSVTRRPTVARWETEGWCGMTTRFPKLAPPQVWPDFGEPVPGQVWSGHRVRITGSDLSPDLLDVSLDVRGEPEELGRFDPLDGAVELVRQPRLRAEVRGVDPRRGGPVARSGDLAVGIRPVSGRVRERALLRIRTGEREACVALGPGSLLEAGGVTVLPAGFDLYTSNHEMGEVRTAFGAVRDGLRVELSEAAPEVLRANLELLGRLELAPHLVRIVNFPERPENRLRTLRVSRRSTHRTFHIKADEPFRFESPEGAAEALVLSAGGD
jgi:hypothetical protein